MSEVKTKFLTQKEIKENVASNFRTLREKRGESVNQLVEAINALDSRVDLKRQSITSIEDGLSVGFYNVYLLSKLTGLTMDEIFTQLIAKNG